MTFTWHRFASTERTKPVSALVGGTAALALIAAALLSPGTDDTTSAQRTRHGSDPEYTSPTQPAMSMGATTVGPTEQMPSVAGTEPAITFAAPRVKAPH
ncbi:hypothetical protein ABIA30_004712 [Mycobacterium sp. MAA66]|uniref:hypothetical protein n=1 Tax=Mycobacterium sp. MAA66 TaxID=3156297 RepID=UPI00351743CC